MKKIIVTGATGFIGSACLKVLQSRDLEIHAISSAKVDQNNHNLNWHQIDLTNTEQVEYLCKKVKADYLLHLAWNISDKKYNNNQHYDWVKIGIDLIDTFKKYGGERVVVSGTCAEYDWNYEYCSEQHTPLKSQNAYGASKHALQLLLDSFAKHNKLSYAWGRIFFAYGPHGNSNSLIPYIIESLKNNKFVKIKQGNFIRDYIYVDDIADALVTLIESDIQGAVNISSETPTMIKDIALKIADYFGKRDLIIFENNGSSLYSCVVGDNSRLQKELHWKPKVSIEEGIKRTVESLV